MSADEFDQFVLRTELTSECGFCRLLRFPMSLFNDCARGNSEMLGVDMRGDGWRLMVLGASITAYCGYCGRIDPMCRHVPLKSRRQKELRKTAAACGWMIGDLVGRSSVHDGLLIYVVTLSPPEVF